jgi:hypothetical protein
VGLAIENGIKRFSYAFTPACLGGLIDPIIASFNMGVLAGAHDAIVIITLC